MYKKDLNRQVYATIDKIQEHTQQTNKQIKQTKGDHLNLTKSHITTGKKTTLFISF
jgi:hypothetical protein